MKFKICEDVHFMDKMSNIQSLQILHNDSVVLARSWPPPNPSYNNLLPIVVQITPSENFSIITIGSDEMHCHSVCTFIRNLLAEHGVTDLDKFRADLELIGRVSACLDLAIDSLGFAVESNVEECMSMVKMKTY